MVGDVCEISDKNLEVQKFITVVANAESTCQVTSTINKNCTITKQDNIVNNFYCYKREKVDNTSIIYQVPNPTNSFRGRTEEIRKIDYLLRTNQIVVIYGMGGIGKTELTKHFTNINRENFLENLVWINAKTRENLITSFYGLARMLQISTDQHISTIVQLIYSHFKDSIALFVFDNAENRDSLRDFLPSVVAHKNVAIFVLITSQNSNWGDDISTIGLDSLPENVSLEVIQAILAERYDEKYREDWLKLVNFLNNIPLALQIVGADINEEIKSYEMLSKTFDVGAYITELHESKENALLNKTFPDNTDNDYTYTIYASVHNNLQRIIKMNTPQSETALEILYVASYLDAAYIDYNTFLKMKRINKNERVLVSSYSILFRYSLMSPRKDYDLTGSYLLMINIHRLVQWVLRYHQENEQLKNCFYTMTLDLEKQLLKECHKVSVFHFGKQNPDICVDYYLTKRLNEYLIDLTKFSCDQILTKIFKTMFWWQVRKLILSEDLLLVSVQFSNVRTINLMLKYVKCDVNKKYFSQEWTLLHLVANSAQIDKIKLLLDLNADVNVEDRHKLTPLHILFGARWVSCRVKEDDVLECAKLIISSKNLYIKDKHNNFPIYYAMTFGFPKVVKYLLEDCELHLDIIGLNDLLHTLLKVPEYSFKELGKIVFKNGAKVNLIHKGLFLLHETVGYKRFVITKWLVEEHNCNVNVLDKENNNVLHKLNDVNCYDEEDNENLKEIFKFLVNSGADLNWKNNDGLTPIEIIQKGQNSFILQ